MATSTCLMPHYGVSVNLLLMSLCLPILLEAVELPDVTMLVVVFAMMPYENRGLFGGGARGAIAPPTFFDLLDRY